MTLTAVLSAALAMPAWADKLSLNAMSRYLNTLQTGKGDFTQLNSDGTISTGKVYIRRPGRIRFEYDPPHPALVIAGGGNVAVFDPKSNTPPEQYPLSRTPLSLILARNVDLGQSGMVVGHGQEGPATTVIAQDPDHPEIGNIKLVFTPEPTELRQWVITDESGSETTVILGALEKGGRLNARLFDIVKETEARLR